MSRTFHGRDVFAPVAAHLAHGAPLRWAASSAIRCVCPWSLRSRTDGPVTGHVVHVDRFGNLITDVPAAWVGGVGVPYETRAGDQPCTYADAPVGALLMLVGSAGTLEIAERDGNAAALLGVGAGKRRSSGRRVNGAFGATN